MTRKNKGESQGEGLSGPYRDMTGPLTSTLTEMGREIDKENKVGIQLPENIKTGDAIPLFDKYLINSVPKIDPKEIVFYSISTGMLKYVNQSTDKWTKKIRYDYGNPTNPELNLSIELDKKKSQPSMVYQISTKADLEKKEIQSKEERKKRLGYYIKSLNQTIEGFEPADLEDYKPDLERLIFSIKEKLENKK